MALQVLIGRDWVNYTAGTTVLPTDGDSLNFRDTALAHAAGIANFGPIQLPWNAAVLYHGIDGADAAVTASRGDVKPVPKGSAAVPGALPAIESALNYNSTPRTATDTNEAGVVPNPPRDFIVRYTGIAGGATTISAFAHVQRRLSA